MLTQESISDLTNAIINAEKRGYKKGYDYAIESIHGIYKVLGWQGGTIHQVIERIKELLEREQILAEHQDDQRNM